MCCYCILNFVDYIPDSDAWRTECQSTGNCYKLCNLSLFIDVELTLIFIENLNFCDFPIIIMCNYGIHEIENFQENFFASCLINS